MRNGPYVLVVPPDDYPGKRYRGRYAYEHRVMWWKKTGKNPDHLDGVIHHKNENTRDNSKSNVTFKSHKAHTRTHKKPATIISHVCAHCASTFERRKGISPKFCSRRCIGLFNYRKRSKGNTREK